MNNFIDIPDLTPEQFRKFADFILEKASITMKEQKITLLSNRLRKRLRALHLESFDTYYELLTRSGDDDELTYFLEVVTTNESYFWRTIRNYDMLKARILPELIQSYPSQRLKFWSAGCSTGEEPYNIAMELTESMKLHGVFDFEVLATDISQRVIDVALAATYGGRTLDKVPRQILHRYFIKNGDDASGSELYKVRSDIMKRINFKVANLFEFLPEGQHCIFCRNVMIYFSREVQEQLVARFYKALKPNGYLIIGHSESLQLMKNDFSARSFEEGIAYKKVVE